MTLKELSQLYKLNQEIDRDFERLNNLRIRMSCLREKQKNAYDGGAYKQLIEQNVTEIMDLESVILAKQVWCDRERAKLARYIAEIQDSLTRDIFYYRFMDGMSWSQVAIKIGGGNTESGVRKRVYRELSRKK